MEPKRVQYIETPPRKNTLAKPAKTAAATVGRPTGSCESVGGGGGSKELQPKTKYKYPTWEMKTNNH